MSRRLFFLVLPFSLIGNVDNSFSDAYNAWTRHVNKVSMSQYTLDRVGLELWEAVKDAWGPFKKEIDKEYRGR